MVMHEKSIGSTDMKTFVTEHSMSHHM